MRAMLQMRVSIAVKLIHELAEVRLDGQIRLRIIWRQQPIVEPHDALVGFEPKLRVGLQAAATLQACSECLPETVRKVAGRWLFSRVHQPKSSIFPIGRKIRLVRDKN